MHAFAEDDGSYRMRGPNAVIHQPMRLKIMAVLNTLGANAALQFTCLRTRVGATDGNLSTHLERLEKAGYIVIEKGFIGKKPQTCVRLTLSGRRAYAHHVTYLREILDAGLPPA